MRLLPLLLVSGFCLPAQKPPPGTVVQEPLGAALDGAVQRAAPSFWGAVLVAVQGEPVLAKGYGFADRQKVPMAPASLFDLGGASQQFTALLVLQRCAEGKLDPADALGRHLPGLPPALAGLRVEQLLDHTAGLPTTAEWPGQSAATAKGALQALARVAPIDRPGAAFHYSPLHSTLLALLLEQQGPLRFDRLLVERCGRPCGAPTLGLAAARPEPRLVTARRTAADERGAPATAVGCDWRHRGHRGVLASVLDLHGWLGALCRGQLLDEAGLQRLWQPVAGDPYRVEALPGGLVAVRGHTEGYRARWIVQRASRSWVVVLTEDHGPTDAVERALLGELAAALAAPATGPAGAPPTTAGAAPPAADGAALPAAAVARWAGAFDLPQGGGTFRIEAVAGRLWLCGEGRVASRWVGAGLLAQPAEARALALEDRGLALLERLLADPAAARAEAFVAPAAADAGLAALAAATAGRGALQRARYVGSASAGGTTSSWFRLELAGGTALLQVAWADERRFAALAAAQELPFREPLQLGRADWARLQAPRGQSRTLTMEGRPGSRRLVFDCSGGEPDGLVEASEAPVAPR